MHRGTLSVVVFRAILETFGDTRENAALLLAALGIDEVALRDPDGRFPVERLYEAQDAAARVTGDDAFGLHLGERAPVGALEAIELAVRSSETVAEGLDKAVRFFALITDDTYLELGVDGDAARLAHRPAGDYDVPRHGAEMVFSAIVTRARLWTGRGLPLRRVRFAHGCPTSASEHARIFQAPVQFDAPVNDLTFDRSWLSTPLRTADGAVAVVLDRFTEPAAEASRKADAFTRRVRRAIVDGLEAGDLTVGGVAARVDTSPRTLQRKLGELGTSYQRVLDAVRCEVATTRITGSRVGVAELAAALGFSGTAALDRAFKRWTGLTPLEYRAGRASS
jgi:AraC-like DNA-binding protein